ncbi:hypothetical protein HYT58_01650, partial [Candidatus Woesearchaeota archaeon]|nr:hypothetical protein [Candidatus Woesearchaeota archaeon]
MVKKEYYSIWVLLLLILSVVMISLPSLTITGNASQVVAFDQVVSMYYPGSYDVSRVVAIPPGKESGNYIGPWDTVLYLTLPQKEVNIENNPSDSQFVDLIFNKNLEIKKP